MCPGLKEVDGGIGRQGPDDSYCAYHSPLHSFFHLASFSSLFFHSLFSFSLFCLQLRFKIQSINSYKSLQLQLHQLLIPSVKKQNQINKYLLSAWLEHRMSKSPWLTHGKFHTYRNPLRPRQMELFGQAIGMWRHSRSTGF